MKNTALLLMVSLGLLVSGIAAAEDPRDPVPLTGPAIACDTDADCQIVELGCCDHCNGGWVASVNWRYAERVEESNHETCPPKIMCTLKACMDRDFPRCERGECIFVREQEIAVIPERERIIP